MTLTRLVHGTIGDIQAERAARYGENLGEVLATACYHPDKLTPAQAVILDAFFNNLVALANRYKVQVALGDFDTDWRTLSKPVLTRVLAYPQGKLWLEDHPLWTAEAAPPELTELIHAMLKEATYTCNEQLDELLGKLPDDA